MPKPFSFANLIGGGQRSRAAAEDEDHTEATEDEDEPVAGEDDPKAEGEYDENAPKGEEDEEDTARRAVLAERRRVASILALATPHTVAQAAALATQTDLTVAQARAVLSAAPKPAGGLADLMRGRAAAPVAPSAGGAVTGNLPPELQAAQARRVNKER